MSKRGNSLISVVVIDKLRYIGSGKITVFAKIWLQLFDNQIQYADKRNNYFSANHFRQLINKACKQEEEWEQLIQ